MTTEKFIMAKTEKAAFGLLVFLLIVGVAAKFYRLKTEPPGQRFIPRPAGKVPARESPKSPLKKEPETPKILNLNSATAEELAKLPYIGKSTAQRIVAFRSSHGPFKSKTDLLRVEGISISHYKKIEPYLTLS